MWTESSYLKAVNLVKKSVTVTEIMNFFQRDCFYIGAPCMYVRVGFNMQVANIPTYPVKCRFPLLVALCDHNPPMLDRQMDIMLAA